MSVSRPTWTDAVVAEDLARFDLHPALQRRQRRPDGAPSVAVVRQHPPLDAVVGRAAGPTRRPGDAARRRRRSRRRSGGRNRTPHGRVGKTEDADDAVPVRRPSTTDASTNDRRHRIYWLADGRCVPSGRLTHID